MSASIHVLYVDDDEGFADRLADALSTHHEDMAVTVAHSVQAGEAQFVAADIDCIVSAYDFAERDGLDLLAAVRSESPDFPFLLCPKEGSERIASDAISAGVTDYLRRDEVGEQFATLAIRIEDAVSAYREQQETRETEQLFQEVTANSTDCLWVFDSDWEELLFVSGYDQIWHRPTEKIEENPEDFMNGVHPEDRAFVQDVMDRLSAGESVDVEYRILRGEGETGWVWVKAEPVTDESGAVVRVVGLTRDITERKTREQELELRTQAIDEAPVGIVITDPSLPDNPMVYVNDRFLELTGYDRSEALGRNCRFLQGEETRDEPVAELRAAIDEERPATVELRNYRKDGAMFWNRVSVAPVHDEGELRHFIGFQEPVTERKQRQQQLQVLDRILRHNIRNRITVVRSRAETIQSGSDGELATHAAHIIDACADLAGIAEKERIVTQSLSEYPQTAVQLRPLLRQAASVVAEEYTDASVTLDCPEGVTAVASPRIENAFEELLTNAITHTDAATPEVSVTVTPETDVVHVDIKDTCPPIPEMERDVLLGHEETPLSHGGGLGLWLVNLLVTQSDGTITVTSDGPRGNTVRVTLPTEADDESQ